MKTLSRRVAAGLLVGGLVMAGCSQGDDDASAESGPGTTVAATVDAAKKFELDGPVTLVALISDPDNSSDGNAIPDFNDGARMAIEEINEAGGLGGHDIELVTVDTPPVGDEVVNSYNLAMAEEPTVLLGPVSSTASLAISERAGKDEVPLMHNSTDSALATDGEGGNEWTFATRPRNDVAAASAATFLRDELDASNVGILSVNASFGQEGVAAAKEVLGGSVGPERSFEFDATNLTEPVQAMEGVDAIFDWGTPNTLSASVITAAQQGLDVPHMGPGSIGFSSFQTGVGDDSILENVYGTVDCIPTDDEREHVAEWAERFEAKFDYPPSYSAAELYDSVYMVRQVVEEAESADPEAIRDGLKSIEYTDGLCALTYKNDNGFLTQESSIGQYQDGKFVSIKRYEN